MLQERTDHFGIELLQREERGRHLETLSGKLEEQLEAAGIGVTGVLTGTFLMCEGLAKEWRLYRWVDKAEGFLVGDRGYEPMSKTR